MIHDPPLKALIVDSQPFIRQGIRAVLQAGLSAEIVGEATDGYAAILAAGTASPSLVILESSLSGLTAYETVSRLRQIDPGMAILVFYEDQDPLELHELLQLGVSGLIPKSAEPDELLNAVRAAIGGGTYLPKSLIARLYTPGGTPSVSLGNNLYGLTKREIEILRHVADGLSSKQTAHRLNLSVRTVETHRLNIRRKTKAETLTDLVRVARRLHLLPQGPATDPLPAPKMLSAGKP